MREIKFRGKCFETNQWVHGWYVGYSEAMGYIYGDYIDNDEVWQVDAETVGQFTGLIDKNRKEIYEGDIVRCWGGEQCQGYHEFDEEITVNDMTYDAYYVGQWDGCLVIGNIYENPERLGGAE